MKSIVSAVFITMLGGNATLAALPPHYQRQAEFVVVLEVATEAFGISNSIDAVKVIDTDLFEVTAGECTLKVRIVEAEKTGEDMVVGPRNVIAQPEEMICPSDQ